MPSKGSYDPITSPMREKAAEPPKVPPVPGNPPKAMGIPGKYSYSTKIGQTGRGGKTQLPKV